MDLRGSTLHQKELFRYYGMSEDRIHFLPMVIDVDKFKPTQSKQTTDTNTFRFLYVVDFILKQIDVIIDEFLLQFENDQSAQLHLVGEGKHLNHYLVVILDMLIFFLKEN